MRSLDPKVIFVFWIKNFLGTVYIFLFWFVGVFIFEQLWTDSGILPKEWIILILDIAGCLFFALLLLGCYYWAWWTLASFLYDLQKDGLSINRGVLIRRHIFIPYTTISNAEIVINPVIVRLLQLYSLQITTRELDNTEGVLKKQQTILIPGLTQDSVKSLRTELLNYSHIQPEKKTFNHS